VWFFSLLCFTLCPFVTKKGSNFYFWTGNVFPNRSSDFFFQNGQRGSLLVFWPHSVWTKSLMCKDVVNRDSTFQSIFRRLYTAKKIEDFRFPVSRPDINLSTA
jgi:hypothetical protein